MLIQKITESFKAHKVPFAIVGGYAVALHGALRGTVDVDIVIRLKKKDFLGAEAALKSLGLNSRLPVTAEEVFQFRQEYIERRNLVAWTFVNPNRPIEIVDIILTEDLSEHTITTIRVGKMSLPVLEIGELIAMKKRSGRPQDLEDVRALETIRKSKGKR